MLPQALAGIALFGLIVSVIACGVIWKAGASRPAGLIAGVGAGLALPLLLRLLRLAYFVGEDGAFPSKAVESIEPEPVSLPPPGEELPMRLTPKDRPEVLFKDLDKPSPRERRIYNSGLGAIGLTFVCVVIMNIWSSLDRLLFRAFAVGTSLGVVAIVFSLGLYTLRLNRRR